MREKNSSHAVKHELNPRVHRRLMLRSIVDQYLELLYHEITLERVKKKLIARKSKRLKIRVPELKVNILKF